jgi:hypothetical protein
VSKIVVLYIAIRQALCGDSARSVLRTGERN